MKKILPIIGLSILLSWCSLRNNVAPVVQDIWETNPIEITTQEVKTFWLIEETIYAQHPSSFSWCVLLTPEQLNLESYHGTWITPGIGNNFYKCKEVYWYNHIYSVPSLWINITYDHKYDMDLSLFLKKDMQPFLATNTDAIYSLSDSGIFIKLLKNTTLETPHQIMQNLWGTADCVYSLNTGRTDQNVMVYDSPCSDERWTSTRYIFDKIKTDYYYQQTYIDSCAPPPCDVFNLNTIDLFLK